MATVQSATDLYSKGNEAFVDENYQAAIELYNQAIELDDGCSEYYANRAHAFLKLEKYEESLSDTDAALELGLKNGKNFYRKGVACFHLKKYEKAQAAFTAAQSYEDVDKHTSDWIAKCNKKIKKQASEVATMPTVTPVKLRHDWYQTEPDVIVVILVKNAKAEDVDVQFTEKTLKCQVIQGQDSEDYILDINLAHLIIPSKSVWRILPSKIEIKLKKADGIQWSLLEAKETNSSVKHFVPVSTSNVTNVGHSYPSSSTKKKDWDKIVVDLKKDDENLEGEAAVNQLFQKIYAEGSDEVKKAMNKSFVESGGTVLSTNWKDIGEKKVDIKPPDGMEWKKWDS